MTVPPPVRTIVSPHGFRVNVAIALFAASSASVHVPVPAHAPAHPANVEVASGAAVSVTVLPPSYCDEQVEPQLIPAGAEVTTPPPVPALATVTGYVNRAETLFAELIGTSHVPLVPVHAPVHPANVAPRSGAAVSVTTEPASSCAEQEAPQ